MGISALVDGSHRRVVQPISDLTNSTVARIARSVERQEVSTSPVSSAQFLGSLEKLQLPRCTVTKHLTKNMKFTPSVRISRSTATRALAPKFALLPRTPSGPLLRRLQKGMFPPYSVAEITG